MKIPDNISDEYFETAVKYLLEKEQLEEFRIFEEEKAVHMSRIIPISTSSLSIISLEKRYMILKMKKGKGYFGVQQSARALLLF